MDMTCCTDCLDNNGITRCNTCMAVTRLERLLKALSHFEESIKETHFKGMGAESYLDSKKPSLGEDIGDMANNAPTEAIESFNGSFSQVKPAIRGLIGRNSTDAMSDLPEIGYPSVKAAM